MMKLLGLPTWLLSVGISLVLLGAPSAAEAEVVLYGWIFEEDADSDNPRSGAILAGVVEIEFLDRDPSFGFVRGGQSMSILTVTPQGHTMTGAWFANGQVLVTRDESGAIVKLGASNILDFAYFGNRRRGRDDVGAALPLPGTSAIDVLGGDYSGPTADAIHYRFQGGPRSGRYSVNDVQINENSLHHGTFTILDPVE